MEQRYLSIPEAAKYLGMTEAALRNRIARRTIVFLKEGGRIKFDRIAIDKHMKKHELVTDQAAA